MSTIKDDGFGINLESMSDEERAIYEEELATANNAGEVAAKEREDTDAAIKAAAEEPEDDEDADDEDEEDAPADEPPAAAADTPPAPVATTAPAPAIIEFTEEQKTRLGEIEAAKDALVDKFDDGELTREDYKAQVKALETEERGLATAQATAEASKKAVDDWNMREWQKATTSFLTSHPEMAALIAEGSTPEQKAAFAKFDDILIKLAKSELAPDNDADVLEEALATFHRRNPGVVELPKPKVEVKKADKKKRPPMPPSLANVPAAAMAETDGSAFGRLDDIASKDGAKLEDIMARMTPEQLDAYARSPI